MYSEVRNPRPCELMAQAVLRCSIGPVKKEDIQPVSFRTSICDRSLKDRDERIRAISTIVIRS